MGAAAAVEQEQLERRVQVTTAFRDDFNIVAEYYQFEKCGEMEKARQNARDQLAENRDATIAEYRKMASWMVLELPEKDVSVAYSGTGYEFCPEEEEKKK